MAKHRPVRVGEVSWLERNVDQADQWTEFIARKWETFRKSLDES